MGSGYDYVVCPLLSPVFLMWLDSELLGQASDPWVPLERAEDTARHLEGYVDGEQSSQDEISGCRRCAQVYLGSQRAFSDPLVNLSLQPSLLGA